MSHTEPLRIDLDGRSLTFVDLDDMRFALESRADVPVAKVRALQALDTAEIHRQAVNIRKVENRLIELLGDTYGEPLGIDSKLRELDPRIFSEDHNWRELIRALAPLSSDFADFKRVALLAYLNYLGTRQGLLGELHSVRQSEGTSSVASDPSAISPDRMGETTVFMASPSIDSASPSRAEFSDFVRLERCVPVKLGIAPGQEVSLKLSSHQFRLRGGDKLVLIDEYGTESALPEGRSLVGRAPENDVAVDATHRSVSRKHLVVDKNAGNVYLTDLSSLGTFVDAAAVAPG